MIEGILEQIRAWASGLAAGALAPFQSVWDFLTQLAPMWAIVLGLVLVCAVIGWFMGPAVRWFLGWVVWGALAGAAGATWMWFRDRGRQREKPKPPPKPKPPTQGQWPPWP